MIKSMTGYGGAKSSWEGFDVSLELKSVNNRSLDVQIRSPRSLMFAEEAIKSSISANVKRGKVEVFINLSNHSSNDTAIIVNHEIAKEYKAAIDQIAVSLNIPSTVRAIELLRLDQVMTLEKKEIDHEKALEELQKVLALALADYDQMRFREGQKLFDDIMNRISILEEHVSYIEMRSPETVVEYREKLTKRMEEILGNSEIDSSRILTEAAIYADKIAVDEETVRLRSHFEQIRLILKSSEDCGKKLEFIVQELNRETNTIGSKCKDTEITKRVLEMKSQIEKIREQIQNIE